MEQCIILLEIPAIPMPAAMLARTMARAVQLPMTSGPMISARGSVVMRRGYLALCISNEITPRSPHEKRKPKPML